MAIAVVILAGLCVLALAMWWLERRKMAHIRRCDESRHRSYLRSRRRSWVRKWLYGERRLLLPHVPSGDPAQPARGDGQRTSVDFAE